MSTIFNFLLIMLGLSFSHLEAAKILAVFPYPGRSQYISAQNFLKALAAKGHELTVISQFPLKEKLQNFRDIIVKYEGHDDFIKNTITGDNNDANEDYAEFMLNTTLCVLKNEEVQNLMKSHEKFDLVITEVFLTEALYALGPHFNAHLIGFSSYGTDDVIDLMVGNTSPLSYIPLTISTYTNRMNFWQRLENLSTWLFYQYFLRFVHLESQREIYEKYFPHLPHKLEDIRKNFSLILLNQHFSISFPRPYVPNMIEVGGLYLDHKPKPLPKDIEDFITNAEHGVIYFSMGSNVKSKDFPKDKLKILIKIFSELKQRVLWKFEEPNLSDKPENVLISNWFPQPDILGHPNVKLFITHAGLLSTIEAIYHAKPIVGIPVFFDQFLNIERAKQRGFGLGVPYKELNEKDLKAAIFEILSNQSYTKAAQVISKRYHDQPIKPLDNAIFWTEYILRHNGAEHMRVAARDLNFIQFYSLDTLGFIFIVIILILIALIFTLRFVKGYILTLFTNKDKKKIA